MDLTRSIDNYCERLGPGFWAEPVNAATNAAFILAAAAAYAYAARRGRADWALMVLVTITVLVGIGSFLFHTFATVWAAIADVVPIQFFIVFYFALAMRRFAGMAWWVAVVATAAFVAFSALAGPALAIHLDRALNGSEGYVPPLAALIAVGLVLVLAGRHGAGWSLIAAGGLFAVSLTFRTVDMAVCDVFPLGAHFIWHTLNGVLLGGLIVAMARFGTPGRGQGAGSITRS